MGWVALLLLALAAGLVLWRMGMARGLASFAGAGLMLGAAGYAWQGRPGLDGAPGTGVRSGRPVEQAEVDVRWAMWGRFTAEEPYFVAADAMRRAGRPAQVTQVMLGGVRSWPGSASLWTGLGSALAEAEGQISPAARLAFLRASQLAPQHPGPPFYYGLALAETGDLAATRRAWLLALRRAPPDTDARAAIALRLVLLDRLLAGQR